MKSICSDDYAHWEWRKNIIALLDAGSITQSVGYIDMELCDFSLRQYVDGAGKKVLPTWGQSPRLSFIVPFMQEILSALNFIHDGAKVVIRNLCPSNSRLPYLKG